MPIPRQPSSPLAPGFGPAEKATAGDSRSRASSAPQSALRRHLLARHYISELDSRATEASLTILHEHEHQPGIIGPAHARGNLGS
jgi:hypothetical protein